MVSILAPQFLHLTGSSEPRNIARSARLAGISSKQFSRKHDGQLMKTFTADINLTNLTEPAPGEGNGTGSSVIDANCFDESIRTGIEATGL
jgi:hypothetical protein